MNSGEAAKLKTTASMAWRLLVFKCLLMKCFYMDKSCPISRYLRQWLKLFLLNDCLLYIASIYRRGVS